MMKDANSLPSLLLTSKKEMCYFSSVITQNRTPKEARTIKYAELGNEDTLFEISNLNNNVRHHLHNPILINKKIRGLQVTVYYHRRTVVQIIHSPSLKIESLKEDIISREVTQLKETAEWNWNKGQEWPNHTASRAILNRLRSSNWLLGRWINLYKLPLPKEKDL